MSIETPNRAGRVAHPVQQRRRGFRRIAARVALGIAAGLLLSLAIHLARPGASAPSAPAPAAEALPGKASASARSLPRMVLHGIVRGADTRRPFALISLGGAAAREFYLGDQLAEGVQLIDIASSDVGLVSEGRMFRLALENPPAASSTTQRSTARSANDWRSAASTRSHSEPPSAPLTLVAPARGFDAASSSAVDRAVWRARQRDESP